MEKIKELIATRFSKAQTTYEANALAQQKIVARLMEILSEVKAGGFSPESMLEIGCGTGLLTRNLLSSFSFKTVHLNDISPAFAPLFSGLSEEYDYRFFAGDAEKIILERKYDLIVSSSVFHWFDNPSVFFEKIGNHLSPGGIVAFSAFGPENVKEVKELTGKGLSYQTKTEWAELLSHHFQILRMEEDFIKLQLNSPYHVLRHLKQTGVNAIQQPVMWTPSKLRQFDEAYRSLFSVGEQVTLTYHPIYFVVKQKII